MNREYVIYRLARSEESLRDAFHLFELGSWNATINRLYYAGFYAVSALLVFKNINVKTHDGVKTQFNLHFIKTGIFEIEYGEIFAILMNLRQKGDYADLYNFTKEGVEILFNPTEKMVHSITEYIQNEIK